MRLNQLGFFSMHFFMWGKCEFFLRKSRVRWQFWKNMMMQNVWYSSLMYSSSQYREQKASHSIIFSDSLQRTSQVLLHTQTSSNSSYLVLKTKLSSVRRTHEKPQQLKLPIQLVRVMNFSLLIISIVRNFSFEYRSSKHSHSYFMQILHTVKSFSQSYTTQSSNYSFFFVFGRPGCPFLFLVGLGMAGALISGCLFFMCVQRAAQDPQAFPQTATPQMKSLGTYSFLRL